MKIQVNNDFELVLRVLAHSAVEPMASAQNARVFFQNLDAPSVRWSADRITITASDELIVAVPAVLATTTGRYLVGVYYDIAGVQRYAENAAAFTLVRTAAEADTEGLAMSADLMVAFAASGKNGLSAFELAQQAGYSGSFEEWLTAGENASGAAIAAGDAANKANIAAEVAQTAGAFAERAAETAYTATDEAIAAAIAADNARSSAIAAAQNANASSAMAENARVAAERATANADRAAGDAEKVVTEANEAISRADTAAEKAAENATAAENAADKANSAASQATLYEPRIAANTQAIIAETERAAQAEADAIEQGRQLAKRDLFIDAGALYNDTDAPITRTAPWKERVQHLPGHYYLNGLGDITEDEMAVIYSEKYRLMLLTGRDRAAQHVNVRTFWVNQVNDNIRSFYKITDPYMAFYGCANLEVLTFVASSGNFVTKNAAYMPSISSTINYMLGFVADCPKLKYISALNVSEIAQMQPSWGTFPPFRGCVSLIEVSLFGLKCDVSFADSPNISKRSVLYAIENGLPVTAITITLHSDAYARLAEDSEIIEALEAQPLITLVSA